VISGKEKVISIPLTFKGKDTYNSVQLKWFNTGYSAPSIDMEVSINDGEWRPYEIADGVGEDITLSANDTVKFRGNNETLGNVPPGPGGYWQFIMTGIIEARGNIMSLLDKSCERTDVPPAAFIYMFSGCTSLTTAPELPATVLASGCYKFMFSRCTSLTTAPELPAITLADLCYHSMFYSCTSLTELTVYADDISADNALGYWLTDTASDTTGTLYALGSADFTGKVPNNWTISRTTPPKS